MCIKSKFSVSISPMCFSAGVLLNVVVVFIVALQIVTSETPPPAAMYFSFGLFNLVGLYSMLITKLFKVTVNGSRISVRSFIGRKYSFDVTEIVKIKWRITKRGEMHAEKILIWNASGKRLSIESLMVGFNDMETYLTANVDESKITYIRNKI